jgi:hypothetical protein
MRFVFSLGACALLLAAVPVTAQDKAQGGRRLLDAAVSLDGRRLGRVSDVALTDSGSVRELIVRTADGLVAVPYSSVRYDHGERAYVVARGTTLRPVRAVQEPAPGTDRFARAGRLVREAPPEPAARIERTPAPRAVPDAVSQRLQDFARAARTYAEPTGSVSMTRNIDRLPARSAVISNETTASELYGWRSPYRRIPPPLP